MDSKKRQGSEERFQLIRDRVTARLVEAADTKWTPQQDHEIDFNIRRSGENQ